MADDRRFGDRRSDDDEPEAPAPGRGALYVMIQQNKKIDEEGHERNHERADGLAERADDLERRCNKLERDVGLLQKLADDPPKVDVSNQLFFPMRVVITMVAAAATFAFVVGAGQWAAAHFSTSGIAEKLNSIQSDVRNAATTSELVNKEIRYEQARQSDRLKDQEKEIEAIKERRR